MTRSAIVLTCVALAGLTGAAFAQDESAAEAMVRAQQEIHARQMQQLHRAEVRLVDPLVDDPSRLRVAPHASGTATELPPPREKGEGSAPWLLAVVAVAAGAAGLVLRSRRRNRDPGARPPGHQGLRRE